ncbi:hypothetical protein CMEL01_07288 [Colletotrichum melonis]|uniref:Uncharacterized protein n=1 Tax=Colletotrichum melonis TaxID=1209925 RepID=A0AAI9U1K2_9PEZI|nr:hypothetical protein CMEL01_07288 [Colletotrichum melonis]
MLAIYIVSVTVALCRQSGVELGMFRRHRPKSSSSFQRTSPTK